MNTQDRLRQVVATFFNVTQKELLPGFPLKHPQLRDSIGVFMLAAAIRDKVGIPVTDLCQNRTYGELESAILNLPKTNQSSKINETLETELEVKQSASAQLNLEMGVPSCGIDIQNVEALPLTEDYWEHEFYRHAFAAVEIAYCSYQEHPRMHFAARWCAKEALKKSDATFLDCDMHRMEVRHGDRGSPFFYYQNNGSSRRLPHTLSISHIDTVAVAVVMHVKVGAP